MLLHNPKSQISEDRNKSIFFFNEYKNNYAVVAVDYQIVVIRYVSLCMANIIRNTRPETIRSEIQLTVLSQGRI